MNRKEMHGDLERPGSRGHGNIATGTNSDVDHGWEERSAAIALRISTFLKARKMMQKELAETIGIKPQQVSKILKGNVNLTLETISKLESALGIGLIEISRHGIASTGRSRPKRR
jgi:ribosome-binding protein aMBF1 (putative translation factor)